MQSQCSTLKTFLPVKSLNSYFIFGKNPGTPLSSVFPEQEFPQKFASFFTSKIVLMNKKLDSAVVPSSAVFFIIIIAALR